MQKTILTTLTGYNLWANKKIIETFQTLPEGLIDSVTENSFPTLRKTIYHIWDAQVIWLNRLQGSSLSDWPSKALSDDFAGYDTYFLKNSEEFDQFVQGKSEGFLASPIFYRNLSGKEFQTKAWEIILHCMNHGTYHRGQIITMLRQLKVMKELPSTDIIFYLRDKL
ncbi:MAG: DinB family protein [Chitinophagales bacterium]